MQAIDVVLLVLLAVGIIAGWRSGVVKQLLSFAAIFIGLIVAQKYYVGLGEYLGTFLAGHAILCKVSAFIILCVVVPVLVSLLASVVSAIINKTLVLGTMNKLLGALVGLFKFGLILGALIWVFMATGVLKKEVAESSSLCMPLKAVPETVYTLMFKK